MNKKTMAALISAMILLCACQRTPDVFTTENFVSTRYEQEDFAQVMELLRQEAARANGSRDIRNVIYTGDEASFYIGTEDAQTETESEWMLFLVQYEDKQDEDWYFMFQRRPQEDWRFGDGDCGPAGAYLRIPKELLPASLRS